MCKKCLLIVLMTLSVINSVGQKVIYSSELVQKAQSGDAQAMTDLGFCYERGKGILQDYSKAFEWYKKGADLGNAQAMYNLGELFFFGRGRAKDPSKAFEWYKKAAEDENDTIPTIGAMDMLSTCYRYGYGTIKDLKKSEYWSNKVKEAGNIKAIKLKKAADLGNATAMYNLGYMYDHGEGIQFDISKAMEWYKKAADLGNADAMLNLGLLYEEGKRVQRDVSKAFEWYKKAADLGNADAMSNLGTAFLLGQGTSPDYSKAFEWSKKAADLGNANAMSLLGVFSYYEIKDINSALDWLVRRLMIDQYWDYNEENQRHQIIAFFQDVLSTENKKGEYNSQLRSYKELFNLYKTEESNSSEPNGDAYYALALFYAAGVGTERNEAEAEKFIKLIRSANFANPFFVCRAAELYEDGLLGSIDYKKALEIYEENDEDSYCLAKAASFYIEGKGISKNISKAIELINKSKDIANKNEWTSPLADYLLGKLYFEGNGVKQNRAEAFKLFKVAAEDEEDPDDEAMNMLSTCYRFGFGTAKDLKQAEYWLKKAREAGNEKAKRLYLLSITKEF